MTDLPPPGGYGPPQPPQAPPPPLTAPPAPGWWQASDGNWYPPQQHPGYATTYGYAYAPGAQVGTNGLAIASMVLGILWLWWVGSVLAVVFGHISLGQIKRTGQSGRGMAVAGLVLGYLGVAVFVLVLLLVVLGSEASLQFERIEGQLE